MVLRTLCFYAGHNLQQWKCLGTTDSMLPLYLYCDVRNRHKVMTVMYPISAYFFLELLIFLSKYSISDKNFHYLIFSNLKQLEPVFLISGALYPEIPDSWLPSSCIVSNLAACLHNSFSALTVGLATGRASSL